MKKDQHVIVCLESPQNADSMIACARLCAGKLNGKGIILLNVSKDGNNSWLSQYGLPYIGLKGRWKTAIDGLPTAMGGILAITAVDPKAPRHSITNPSTLLRTFRDCKIAYLAIATDWYTSCQPAENHNSKTGIWPATVALTLDHHRESKEKLIWASYLSRFFGAKLTITLPAYKDVGLRMRQQNNRQYLEKLFKALELHYAEVPYSTFGNTDITTVEATHPDILIALTTDVRERDLGDWLLGPPEKKLLSNINATSLLFLNPKDDLYVLCD